VADGRACLGGVVCILALAHTSTREHPVKGRPRSVPEKGAAAAAAAAAAAGATVHIGDWPPAKGALQSHCVLQRNGGAALRNTRS
jgi:hypothetical protein